MEPDSRAAQLREAASILDQLLKYTEQLASFPLDPKVDVAALAEACGRRLNDLRQVLPRGLKDSPDAQPLQDRVRNLRHQTRLCTDLLQKEMARTGGNIQSLSKSKRAIGAYKS